tara:strand:+ start:377 stop:532 length:156 start_codon:yes stop_codon:yes gene_type:complete
MVDGQAGKGDKYRKVDFKKWDEGWEAAFGKKKKKKKDNKDERNQTGKTTNR